MTPRIKIPTREVYDTTLPKLYHKAPGAPRPLSRLRLDVTDAWDRARARPQEPLPAPAHPAIPCRPYSEALRGVGGQVLRTVQPYK